MPRNETYRPYRPEPERLAVAGLCPCGCGLVFPCAAVLGSTLAGGGRSPEAQERWGHYFENPTRFTQIGTEQRARERGQHIEVAPPNVLQIDIDGSEAYERFEEQLAIWQTCDMLPALGRIVERNSRTPGHKHITIELPEEHPIEFRIMLQALLGSDLKRELLSLASYYNGHETPIVFYRPQEEGNAEAEAEPRNGIDRSTDGPVAGGRERLSDVIRRRRSRRRRELNEGVGGQHSRNAVGGSSDELVGLGSDNRCFDI